MTEAPPRALSEEAMLAALQDIRLPAEAPGGLLAEVLAAAGLGLSAAALIGGLALAVTVRRPATRAPPAAALHERVAGLRALPAAVRLTSLLHLLKAHRPDRFRAISGDLYRPAPDGADATTARADALETALLRGA